MILQKAVDLSPQNSDYLYEVGFSQQVRKELAKALDAYVRAEEAAKTFPPENVMLTELTRALRGQG